MPIDVPDSFAYSQSPITSTTPGEVIENLFLDVTGDQPAITITSDDVTIKNVYIKATTGDGIDVFGDDATISNVQVDAPAATDNGGMDGEGSAGVYAFGVSGLKVDHATFRNTGTGVGTDQAPGTVLSNIEGYDMQGPFPGGQLVQFGESDGSSLTDFYVHNDPDLSHPEDDISVYNSRDVTIARGVVDGDNSPSGVGVMVEGPSEGTDVSDVDAIHMGNGAFSSYSNDVSFRDVRSFDNDATDQGRGDPLSGGLIFYAPGSDVSFDDATYKDPGDPDNVLSGDPVEADIAEDRGATPHGHIGNVFAWTDDGADRSGLRQAVTAQPGATYVFDPGGALDVVSRFQVDGAAHDTLSLPGSDFGGSIAQVLRDAHDTREGVVITDSATSDTIRLAGVSKAELKANRHDISFHA